ncbi:MAG: hypothetical protein J2P23_00285 [Microlunatus sp.]|nr:hypothetical protein [Microlunatus sp.]
MAVHNKLIGGLATAVLGGTVAIMPATVAAAAPTTHPVPAASKVASTTQPVTGTLSDGSTFNGAISNLHTSVVNGVLTLTGTITGTGLPTGGQQFSQALNLNQLAVNNSCNVLTLNLGPLHLDLLGLNVDLAPVNLNITAVPGAGNLLGNLLCSVAGLLDNGGPLHGISALLNRILTGLGLGL